jgi:hypothetical protein
MSRISIVYPLTAYLCRNVLTPIQPSAIPHIIVYMADKTSPHADILSVLSSNKWGPNNLFYT